MPLSWKEGQRGGSEKERVANLGRGGTRKWAGGPLNKEKPLEEGKRSYTIMLLGMGSILQARIKGRAIVLLRSEQSRAYPEMVPNVLTPF